MGSSGMAKSMRSKIAKAARMRVSKPMKSNIAKGSRMRASVWLGHKAKTKSGHKKADFMKNKAGKIVTKKQHTAGKKNYKHIKGWTVACQAAKKELKLKGFVIIKKGSAVYKRAKQLYKK